MMKKNLDSELKKSSSLADIFEVVKCAVLESEKKSRGGLMLGLADLGNHPRGWMGAFFPVGTNIIVMNRIPLIRIKETNPDLYKPYTFHVLLHEYVHTLGWIDEDLTRAKVLEISTNVFGEDHIVTKMARDTTPYFPNLVYPNVTWQPEDLKIELVENFDRSSVCYIG